MRTIAVILFSVVLFGCPGQQRIYIHNKSDSVLTFTYPNIDRDQIVIRPGRSKWVNTRGGESTCVKLDVGGSEKNYLFPRKALEASKGAGYGSRLDAYFEYGRLFIEHEQDGWLEIAEVDQCHDT